ncbi:hypothetical protein ACHAXR_003727 [Thalassiosira sp. AJA248-18]
MEWEPCCESGGIIPSDSCPGVKRGTSSPAQIETCTALKFSGWEIFWITLACVVGALLVYCFSSSCIKSRLNNGEKEQN